MCSISISGLMREKPLELLTAKIGKIVKLCFHNCNTDRNENLDLKSYRISPNTSGQQNRSLIHQSIGFNRDRNCYCLLFDPSTSADEFVSRYLLPNTVLSLPGQIDKL